MRMAKNSSTRTTTSPTTTTITTTTSARPARWRTTRSGRPTTSRSPASASTSAPRGPPRGGGGPQVLFPRGRLGRWGEALSSRYFVVGRETLYESPVALTPYSSDVRIDERAIGELIDDAYGAAGIHPDEVDTGSVILTGEALRRENAQAIGDLLAEMGGEFLCATAGHHMEAMLAAYGSGAAKRSHDEDKHILNVDIGAATTTRARVAHGKGEQTAAIPIGGRLVVVDEAGRITRLDPQGAQLARAA